MNNQKKYQSQKGLFLFLLAIFILAGLTAKAQVKEQIDIVSDYKPKLTEAIKMDVQPFKQSIEVEKPKLTYNNEPAYFPLTPARKRLPAVSLGKKELDPLRNTFLKAGYGNFSNVLAEFNYNTLRDKNKALTAYAKHHSGKGPVKNSDFGEQIVNLAGKKLYDKSTLRAEAYFKNNIYHNYGYNHDSLDFESEDLRTRYTRYGFKANFHNERGDTGNIRYWINAGAHNLGTSRNSGETDLFVKGKVKETIKNNAAFFDAKYRFLDYREGGNAYGRSIFKVNGHYQLNHEIGRAKIGFRTASVNDTSKSPFHFYPYVRVDVPVYEEQLTAFGGIKGNLNVNTYQSFIDKNPYLKKDLSLRNTNNKFEIFGGVKGHFKQNGSYKAEIAYRNVENMPLYVNDSAVSRKFRIRYNNGVAAIFEVNAEFKYAVSDEWNVFLRGRYRNFNLADEENPWHIPPLDYELSGQYKFGEKIKVHASIFGFNQRDYLIYNEQGAPETKKLDGILDLNAGINYRFSKGFSAFFDFNNILSQEYEYWHNYPVRGFHLTGGVKLNLY